MAEHKDIWRTEPDGVLTCRIGHFRLLVEAPGQAGGSARYLVLRREDDKAPETLTGSGTAEDVRTAMKIAVQIVERLIEMERPRLRRVV